MTSQILESTSQINSARNELKRRGLSFVEGDLVRTLRTRRLMQGINVGDHIKSWDILKTVTFLEENVHKEAPILDMGAYASEVLCVLHKMGYSNLTGIDLNSEIRNMPFAHAIKYEVGNMLQTPFPAGAFAAITAISVIEHGFEGQKLLREVSRLLRTEGVFVASFDYWPDKVDTTGMNLFNMDWRIFSMEEVSEFLEEALSFNLFPLADVSLEARNKVIQWAHRNYTFAWLVLQKR